MYKHWRRLCAALILSFTFVPQAAAYDTMPIWDTWKPRSGEGYSYHIPVCLSSNMGAPDTGGDWDLGINRHQRLNQAMAEFNSEGFELFYYRTNTACSTLRDNNVVHLEVAFSPTNIVVDGRASAVAKAQIEERDWVPPCTSHCVEVVRIEFDLNENLPSTPSGRWAWHMNDSWEIPYEEFDFGTVFLHELGHASGLQHSQFDASQMCSHESAGTDCKHTQWASGPGSTARYYLIDDWDGFNDLWPYN